MKAFKLILSLTLTLSLLFSMSAHASEQLIIRGSTSLFPILEKATEAYRLLNPNINIILTADGTESGINALINNQCDIAMISRELHANELEKAQENNIVPRYVIIGNDAILPIVNPSNVISDLTVAQLKDIFTGKIINWKELGGHDCPIVVTSRRNASGTCEVWSEILLNDARITPLSLLQASNNAIVKTVSVNPHAVGYISSSYLRASVKPLSIEGVQADETNIKNRTWITTRKLFVLTDDKPNKTVEDFIEFLLDPEYGQVFVELAGCYKN